MTPAKGLVCVTWLRPKALNDRIFLRFPLPLSDPLRSGEGLRSSSTTCYGHCRWSVGQVQRSDSPPPFAHLLLWFILNLSTAEHHDRLSVRFAGKTWSEAHPRATKPPTLFINSA